MGYLNLPAALAARGLTVEVVPGWETRSNGYDLAAKGALCHWTAGPAGTTGRPSLSIVVNGRANLPGPLANVYLDRKGVAVVVSALSANHGGVGTWGGYSGNSRFFGTEAEAASAADFTVEQRWAYPRVNAAYCDLGPFGADMVASHAEYATPAGRKTDINGYTMADMRAQVAALLADPHAGGTLPGGFAMALNDAQQAELYNKVMALADTVGSLNAYTNFGGNGDAVLRDTYNSATQARNAVLALLAAGGTGVAGKLSDEDLARVAVAVADEQARRQAS